MGNITNTTGNFSIIPMIYGTLILGVLGFLIYALVKVPITNFNYADGTIFMYMSPIFFIVGVLLSNFLFKSQIKKIKPTDFLFSKLTKYQGANIMRGAPLEASGLMATVAFYLTENYYYLILSGTSLFLMFLYFPSKNKFELLVDLNMEEKTKLKKM